MSKDVTNKDENHYQKLESVETNDVSDFLEASFSLNNLWNHEWEVYPEAEIWTDWIFFLPLLPNVLKLKN